MGLSTDVIARACERVFARVCDVGGAVPPDTPAAAFLAGAARRIDEAQERLRTAEEPDEFRAVVRSLGQASALLGDVARLSEQDVAGLERVSVIVDGLCVTLEMDEREPRQQGARRGFDLPRRGMA